MTESLGESQVVQYLIELAKNNTIYLISFEKETDIHKMTRMKNILKNANIKWKYFPYSNRYGLLSTGWQMMSAAIAAMRIIKKQNIKIVHTRSLIPAVMGVFLKKVTKIKLLFDIRGFAIDEKIMDGRLQENSLLTKLLRKLEYSAYKNADHTVTLTHSSKPIIIKKYGTKENSITVIPTCADLNLFNAIDFDKKSFIKEKLGFSQESIIVLRNGTLNNSYDIDAEFKLFSQLSSKNQAVQFLFLNKGQHSLIKDYLDKYEISADKYKIVSADFNQVPSYLNAADVCIFFVRPTFAKQASAPTKFAELIASHVHAVTNTRYGDMEYYLNAYRVGILFDIQEVYSTPEKVAYRLLDYLDQHKNAAARNDDFDNLFTQHFSKEIAVERYQLIYNELV